MILRAGDLIEWAWGDNNHKSFFIVLDAGVDASCGPERARACFQVYAMSETCSYPNLNLKFQNAGIERVPYYSFDVAVRKNLVKKIVDITSLTQNPGEKP